MTDKPAAPNVKTSADDARGARAGDTTMPQSHGGRIGQAPFVVTDELRAKVLEYVSVGLVIEQIASLVKWPDGRSVSRDTIMRHFSEELQNGHLEAFANVAGMMYRGALRGDPKFVRMWMEVHAKRYGLDPKQSVELAGPGGAPIETNLTVRFVKPEPETPPET